MSKEKKELYRIASMNEMFDGLVVELAEGSTQTLTPHTEMLFEVMSIRQPSQLFESFAIPTSGLWVSGKNLERYVEPGEQLTDNPYGVFKGEGKFLNNGIEVLWANYTRAFTVNVRNNGKTVYEHSFFGKGATDAQHLVNCYASDFEGEVFDIENLVFDLGEI